VRKPKRELVEGVLVASGMSCPKCHGSDPLALYEKEDEDGNKYVDGFCYSTCGYLNPEEVEGYDTRGVINKKSGGNKLSIEELESIQSLPMIGWKDRRIKKSTCEFFGVHTRVDDDNNPLYRYYPVTENDEITGFHVRDVLAKEAKSKGESTDKPGFFTLGKNKTKESQLFGQTKFAAGGKFLVIVGGEEDVMSFSQANLERTSYKTPVVSATNGEPNTAAQVKANYDYVSSFEKVIIMLDNDDTGRKAADEVARILKPGQAFICKINDTGFKDPNDYVRNGKEKDLIDVFWKAERYSPVGVYKLSQMWDAFANSTDDELIPFPPSFGKLNEMLGGGIARGEVVTFGAYTSIGKSCIISNIVHHIISQTEFKVGALYLEATQKEVVRDLLSLELDTNLRKQTKDKLDMTYLRNQFFGRLAEKDNFVFIDHQGSLSNDEIFNKLRYLAKAEQCDMIVIDPIQQAVNSSDNTAVIEFMDSILKLAKEANIAVLLVSHMRKPDSDDPHACTEYDLLGSSAINQVSFTTILASRDKMAKDINQRNSTQLKCVKNRRYSETGPAGWLRYDDTTTRLYQTFDPYENEVDLDKELFGEIAEEMGVDIVAEKKGWNIQRPTTEEV
jgi:twinkle protein